jgi:hypothetical protein
MQNGSQERDCYSDYGNDDHADDNYDAGDDDSDDDCRPVYLSSYIILHCFENNVHCLQKRMMHIKFIPKLLLYP